MAPQPFDTSLGLNDVHVLVTGGSGQIGRVVVDAFLAAGALVTVLDKNIHELDFDSDRWFALSADITQDLEPAFLEAESRFGTVQVCVALAGLDVSFLPETESICDADPADWQRVFDVNIHGTFNTCRTWLRRIREAQQRPRPEWTLRNVSLILMGSESGRDGTRTMPAYAASKAAIQYGLLASLTKDLPRIWHTARVNAVAPGTVDTAAFKDETRRFGENFVYASTEATTPLAGAVPAEQVARTILFLASSRYSSSIHGQVVHVDNGRTGSLVWQKGESASRPRGTV